MGKKEEGSIRNWDEECYRDIILQERELCYRTAFPPLSSLETGHPDILVVNSSDGFVALDSTSSKSSSFSRLVHFKNNKDQKDSQGEEEEQHHNPFLSSNGGNKCCSSPPSMPKFQFRNEISRARWDEKMGMGEVIEKKGGMWTCTGVIRNGGKLYCTIEETLFLAERGAMLLLDMNDTLINLKEIYKKVAQGKSGCSWESFEAYKHLKSLGYIVQRHGLPWSLKSEKSCQNPSPSASLPAMSYNRGKTNEELDENVDVLEIFKNMQINEVKPEYDVYLPNSKFRKSSPGDPKFVFCFIRDCPPSRAEIERLERQCNGVPLKFCSVDHGRVCFFSFDRIELPVLL